jgi:hypothetical protein
MAIVEDFVPDGVVYNSHAASQGEYSPRSGQWIVGALDAHASATLEIEVTVKKHAPGTIVNKAVVRPGVGEDNTPDNNTASATIEIRSSDLTPEDLSGDSDSNTASADSESTSDVDSGSNGTDGSGSGQGSTGSGGQPGVFQPVISKEVALEPGALGLPGEHIAWTITVTNEGSASGSDFQVVDTVRPELRVDRAENNRGTASIDGQTVTWTIDRLDPGESVQMRVYTIILEVPPDGLFVNEAVVFGPEGAVTTTAQASGVSTLPATGYAPE